MDTIIENIKTKYKEAAESSMQPINELDVKITDLATGIQTTKDRITNLKADLAQAQDVQDKCIADKNFIQTLDEVTDDTVQISMKIASLERALTASLNTLDALKNSKLSLLQDRATTLRDVIADSYGPVQEQFLSYIEKSHKLFIVWGLLGETLAEDFNIEFGKKSILDDKIQPLSFAQYANDLKYFIGSAADFKQMHLGVKQK